MICARDGCPLHSEGKSILPIKVLVESAFACALQASNGSVQKTAKLLGIGRATAYRMKAEHDRRNAELEFSDLKDQTA